MTLTFQTAESDIFKMCRVILDQLEKSDGQWSIAVAAIPSQLNCSWVFLDHEFESNCQIGRFPIDRVDWMKLPESDQHGWLRRSIEATMLEMREVVPNEANAGAA